MLYDFLVHVCEIFSLHWMQGEEVDYRGVLHRDGSVLMSVSLNQLKVGFGLTLASHSSLG